MNILITKPEVEALIQRRFQNSRFKDAQDLIQHALEALENRSCPPDLFSALTSSPSQDAQQAPVWLKESWAKAAESGLDSLTMEEIEAEIQAARLARRHQ